MPAPVAAPPDAADVWRWARTGVFDGFIFLLGAVVSSIIQVRTGIQWMFIIGILIAVALTNLRKLPMRPKPIKAGYFGGLSGLFAVGMLGMTAVMPRALWTGILVSGVALAMISAAAFVIGLRAVRPPKPTDTENAA